MGADVPRQAPDLAIHMVDGKQILLSQERGKVVCLMFILTTCPHCQKLVGSMSKLEPQLAPHGVLFIAASTQDMPTLYIPDFIRDFKPPFPVGFVDRGVAMQFLHHDPKYIFYNPAVVLIDKKGAIQFQFPGGDPIFEGDQEANFRTKIESLVSSHLSLVSDN